MRDGFVMIYLTNFLIFVATPLMAILGFLMFCYPKMLAKLNARLSNKNVDSPPQLAHTRQVGIIMMTGALFELLSMLWLRGIISIN